MTLYDLIHCTTVQGDVTVCFIDENDERRDIKCETGVTDLFELDLDAYEDCEVNFIWADSDGLLHIELDEEDVEDALREQLADIINERESYPEDEECDELEEAYWEVTNLLAAFD